MVIIVESHKMGDFNEGKVTQALSLITTWFTLIKLKKTQLNSHVNSDI